MGTASSGGNLAEEAKFDDETGEALNAAAREIVKKATTSNTANNVAGAYCS